MAANHEASHWIHTHNTGLLGSDGDFELSDHHLALKHRERNKTRQIKLKREQREREREKVLNPSCVGMELHGWHSIHQ